MERFNAGDTIGGRLETSWDSAGTNNDWLRFLWDFYTVDNCVSNPWTYTLLNIYRETRRNGGLTKGNYYTKTKAAMEELYSDGCLRGYFSSYAQWNGVDNDT